MAPVLGEERDRVPESAKKSRPAAMTRRGLRAGPPRRHRRVEGSDRLESAWPSGGASVPASWGQSVAYVDEDEQSLKQYVAQRECHGAELVVVTLSLAARAAGVTPRSDSPGRRHSQFSLMGRRPEGASRRPRLSGRCSALGGQPSPAQLGASRLRTKRHRGSPQAGSPRGAAKRKDREPGPQTATAPARLAYSEAEHK